MTAWIYLVLVLAVTAVPSAAQQQAGDSTQKADSVRKTAPAAKARHTLSQFVLFPDGTPVESATVVALPVGADSGTPGRGALTDKMGRFSIESLPAGTYDLQVARQGLAIPAAKRVTVHGTSVGDILIPPRPEQHAGWVFLVLVLYLGSIMLVRWHSIARSLDEMIKAQLSALKTRLDLEVDPSRGNSVDPAKCSSVKSSLQESIQRIQDEFRPGAEQNKGQLKFSPVEFGLWSRGRENAAWVAIHEVERQMTAYLTPPERVLSYLQLAAAQLSVIKTAPATALAESIRAWLPTQPNQPVTAAQDEQRRALLGRAIALANEERDKQFSSMMEWHNKASWLILAALLMIFFITLMAGHSILFLAGAAGGFLSRLMRAIRREDLPLDYGASWTTLFLSPLFGALAAWFGIALITLATHPNVNLLGDAFRLVDWNTPTAPATLAVAFLLGFSERLFDSVVGAIERRAIGTRAADEAAKAASAAATATAIPAGAQSSDSAATTSTNGTRPAAAAGAGPAIVLENGPIPVGVVSGKVVLDKAGTGVTGVNLSTNRPEFDARPAVLSIPAGKLEGDFDIVPKGNAPGGSVRVTARVGTAEVDDTIEFV